MPDREPINIIFLGTGSSIPTPKIEGKPFRSYASLLVKIGKEKLLFDVGPGTMTKLQQLGVDTRVDPNHLFISHFHLDHCQDFPALVKGRAFDIQTGVPEVGQPINVYGPTGLQDFSLSLFESVTQWGYMRNNLSAFSIVNLKETMEGTVAETDNWRITCIPIRHNNGVAYKLEARGLSFVYSGDMGYDENLVTLGRNADLVAIECSFPDRQSLQGLHLCPEDVGLLAQQGRFRRAILTHLYPNCEGREQEMIEQVVSISGTPTEVAHDFYKVQL